MNLEQMQLFLSVVDSGSFTAAAIAHKLPKSNVSRHVSELEKELGVALLQRTTRSVNLTEAGDEFYQRAQIILDKVEETRVQITRKKDEVSGNLILYMPTFFLEMCSEYMADVVSTYTHCDFEIHSTSFGQQAAMDRLFDVLLHLGPVPDSSLIARPVCDLKIGYFACPSYIKKYGLPGSPQELSDHRLIHFCHNQSTTPSWTFDKEKLQIKPHIVSDDFKICLAMALEGMGLVQLPLMLASKPLQEGSLISLFDARYDFKVPLFGLYKSRNFMPQRVYAFLEHMWKHMPEILEKLEIYE